MNKTILNSTTFCPFLVDRIRMRQENIHRWLVPYESARELPFYSSVDIRDAGFKTAVVDTNIFPAGFNNLCEHGLADSVGYIREALNRRVPGCRDVLIIAEEHTRNTWYLENIRILEQIIARAGFSVKIATFLTVQPAFCREAASIDLETSSGQTVKIHCLQRLLDRFAAGEAKFDIIIMNNDLIGGIPDILKNSPIPIYPSMHAGWHSRLKSHHFAHTQDLIDEFAKLVDLDPWFFSAFYGPVEDADINDPQDQQRLADMASDLFRRIQEKYAKHAIDEKPYIIIKPDAGTYGMGVLPIEDPADLLHLNRHNRNKLHIGKGSIAIHRYLLQEGIPTIHHVGPQASEVCIYQIEQNLVGGFYRVHAGKGKRDNLNTKGMSFQKMCPHLKKYGDCGIHHDVNIFDVYRFLARIAAVAAHREILELSK